MMHNYVCDRNHLVLGWCDKSPRSVKTKSLNLVDSVKGTTGCCLEPFISIVLEKKTHQAQKTDFPYFLYKIGSYCLIRPHELIKQRQYRQFIQY